MLLQWFIEHALFTALLFAGMLTWAVMTEKDLRQ